MTNKRTYKYAHTRIFCERTYGRTVLEILSIFMSGKSSELPIRTNPAGKYTEPVSRAGQLMLFTQSSEITQ